jgi:hypothetical protein
MYSLPTEPGSIGHTLDAGFKLYYISFKRVLGLGILAVLSVAVPIFVAATAMVVATRAGQEPDIATFALLGVGVLVAMILYLWFYLAAVCRIGSIAYGQDLSFRACTAMGLRRLFPVIVASILYGLALMGGFILFIIPGLIVWLTLAFYALCIVLEGDGILESLKHSHRLVWGNWWRTAIIGTVVLIVYYIISLAIEIPFLVLEHVLSGPEAENAVGVGIMEPALSMVGSILSAVITFPLMASVFVVVFHDLKLRKEGQDLDARVEALTVGA